MSSRALRPSKPLNALLLLFFNRRRIRPLFESAEVFQKCLFRPQVAPRVFRFDCKKRLKGMLAL